MAKRFGFSRSGFRALAVDLEGRKLPAKPSVLAMLDTGVCRSG
jgi:hypothetical protein